MSSYLFRVWVVAGLLITGLLATGLRAAPLPDLAIQLGTNNQGVGLEVPSEGDGANVPIVIQGHPARRIQGGRALYLYVKIKHPAYTKGPVDAYVTVEFFDDTLGKIGLQYDKEAPEPTTSTKYTGAGQSVILTGSGQWRTGYFFLPALRLGHGQNNGADFRLSSGGLAVRRIAVSPNKPAGFDPDAPIDPESLRHLAVKRPAGMEVTFGNDATPGEAALFKALTVSSVESYVDWAGVEPRENTWDWSKWDKQVATLKAAGLKWVPFILAGPAYATPLWFQSGPDSQYYRCLEHGKDSKVQSIFNSRWRPHVERFIKALADRYRDGGVIESLLLGITGIYGESIYPAGPEGGWTARLTGDYHNHQGWWAGDVHASAAFREAMRKRYGNIAALNQAWKTSHPAFDQVATFLPDKAPSDRARADFVEWYQAAMTEWSVFWVKTTRKYFPKTEIYLCTGGNGDPILGADFTAQTAAIAGEEAGVRITNEGSDYAHNFAITREVATATRLYKTFCGFEPASHVSETGVVARIYNATASGARQLHYYENNVLSTPLAMQNFRTNVGWIVLRQPRLDTAIYVPRESWALERVSLQRFYELAPFLRDVTDLDFLTRRTVNDGFLRGCRMLILPPCPVLEPDVAEKIAAWVRQGGTLVAITSGDGELGARLYDLETWRSQLFVAAPAIRSALLKPALAGTAPAHWQLELGRNDDGQWLFGDWQGQEMGREWQQIPDARKRWTGSRPGVLLPTVSGAAYTLRLAASVPRYVTAKGPVQVYVNGQLVGQIEKEGQKEFTFAVGASVVGTEPLARLELSLNTWKPSALGQGTDNRDLGIAVRQISWVRAGAETQPAGKAQLKQVLDLNGLAALTRKVGSGQTILLSGSAGERDLVARVVAHCLPNCPDGKVDGRYRTLTAEGELWYDAKAGKIQSR
ncbi:MAG: alpha-amylase family protein [Verrucomicrobiota bacterium]